MKKEKERDDNHTRETKGPSQYQIYSRGLRHLCSIPRHQLTDF